jgi:hypothetical protein
MTHAWNSSEPNQHAGGASARTERAMLCDDPITRTLRRTYSRVIRDLKRGIFGIESYLNTEDRRVLEQVIFPYFLQRDDYKDVLFVGCHWYTKGYNTRFEEKKNYWTIEPSPSRQRYGTKQHISDTLQNLSNHFSKGALDLILCNGVIGYGLDAKPDAEQAFRASYDCLRKGGVLVLGWADIDKRRPFHPDECQSLRRLRPFLFPPLATPKYVTDTVSRVTYNFYVKPSSAGAG